jgi:TPR repeat protein
MVFLSRTSDQSVSALVRGPTQDFKLAVDQRNTGAQYNSGFVLQNSETLPIHFKVIADYFKRAAHQNCIEAKHG